MGARLRALLVLLVLLGAALFLLVHLAGALLTEQEVRLRERRVLDVIAGTAYSLQGVTPEPAQVEELALLLRQLLGREVWVVARADEEAPPVLQPIRDARPLQGAELDLWFEDLSAERPACDAHLAAHPDGPLCRVGVPGAAGGVMVLLGGDVLRPVNVAHVRILGTVAAVAWLLIGMAGYLAFSVLFVRPLWRIVRAVQRAASTPERARLEPTGGVEFQAIAKAFNDLMRRQEQTRDRIRFQLEELQRAHRELRSTQDSLVRSEQLAQVGVLAAGVAHEVGNPLGVISGYVELLAEPDAGPEERARYVQYMQRALERIQGILRNLLDFSRRDADEAPARATVSEVFHRVEGLVEPQDRFRKKKIQLVFDIDGPLPEVGMPESRLEQVLLNLMINAADAVDERGHIRVSADRDLGTIRIRVEDDGPGIPESLMEHIFEPFVTTKEKGKGTGLGLFVCRHLVTAYGGDIRALPMDDGGSRFEIRIWPADPRT